MKRSDPPVWVRGSNELTQTEDTVSEARGLVPRGKCHHLQGAQPLHESFHLAKPQFHHLQDGGVDNQVCLTLHCADPTEGCL